MIDANDFVAVQVRLAEVLATRGTFTPDDVSINGRFAIDHQHRPNARQQVIGRVFGWASSLGLIVPVDTATRQSRNPLRKRSAQRLWRVTDRGRAWAITFLDENVGAVYVDPQLSLFDTADN